MLTPDALDTLFIKARTHNVWLDKPVSEAQLQQLYDLLKWGPTSANCSPMRIVFAKSDEARARLSACMDAGNAAKVKAAPVTAIIGMDLAFRDKLPQLFPHVDARPWFADAAKIADTAFRNSSLQGGYFILAARALGLDCGPMSGFNAVQVNEEFFAGTSIKANFVCSIGYGDHTKLFARSPRLAFDEACKVI